MSDSVTRNVLVTLLGSPDHTEGSLNSPVELEEHGLRFNEKWTYTHLRDDSSGAPMRAVYWHRYDFVGTLVRNPSDAEWRPDTTLLEATKSGASRRAGVHDAHSALPDNRRYRPASETRDARDLGGYIEGEKR
jgi:hypothetical protein